MSQHGGTMREGEKGVVSSDLKVTSSMPAISLSRSNPRQVVHTHARTNAQTHVLTFTKQHELVPVEGGNALNMRRWLQVLQKVMADYCWVYD